MIVLSILAGLVALFASVGLYIEYRNKRNDKLRQETDLRITIARLKARHQLTQEKNDQLSKKHLPLKG